MRLVLDTNVVLAAMRSPSGASARLLELAAENRVTLLANYALGLEYESVCLRAEHLLAARLSRAKARSFVVSVLDLCTGVERRFDWRPQLVDQDDEMVLEAAIAGRADVLVTLNQRHFLQAAGRFGVQVLTPGETMKRLKA